MTEVRATRVNDVNSAQGMQPGAFDLRGLGITGGMGFRCPCGCGREGYLPFKPEPSPSWHWNGDRERPALTPSVQQVGGCRWHGYLTDGVWRPV